MVYPLHTAVRDRAGSRVRGLLESVSAQERHELLNATDGHGHKPLFYALEYGNVSIGTILLSFSCIEDRSDMLFARGPLGRTLIHGAAECGDEGSIVEILGYATTTAERSRLLTVTTARGGWTALHLAAHKGKAKAVRALLEHATEEERRSMIRAENEQGGTPFQANLPWIGGDDEFSVAMTLLEFSPPEDRRAMMLLGDRKRKTLLHHAAERGHEADVKALLALASQATDRSAMLAAESREGWTALHEAAYRGKDATTRALFEHAGPGEGSKLLQARDVKGRTAFHVALQEYAAASSTTPSGGVPCRAGAFLAAAKALLEAGTASERREMLSTTVQGGGALLHHLARAGEVEEVRAFLSAADGAEEKARLVAEAEPDGWTPLHFAACWGRAGLVPVLLEHAGVQERDRMWAPAGSQAKTPLHLAVGERSGRSSATFCALLTAATDHEAHKLLFLRDASGYTALQSIKARSPCWFFAELNRILVWSDSQSRTLLHRAAETGDVANVQALLELANNARDRSSKVAMKDRHGWTPLHRAAYFGYESVGKVLLNSAHTVEERQRMLADRTADGWTPVHFAQASGVELE